jgi:hypothetical protein
VAEWLPAWSRSDWTTAFVGFTFTGYTGVAGISAVTRQPSNIDLLLVDPNGAVENLFYTDVLGWGQEFTTGNGQSGPGFPIAGTTRTANNLDLFETDSSGNTRYNTFWQAGGNWGTVTIP